MICIIPQSEVVEGDLSSPGRRVNELPFAGVDAEVENPGEIGMGVLKEDEVARLHGIVRDGRTVGDLADLIETPRTFETTHLVKPEQSKLFGPLVAQI